MSRTASIISGLVTLLISMLPAFADPVSLLVGTWTVDVSKLTMPDPPNSVTMVLAGVGGGRYKMTVDIVDQGGARRHGEHIHARRHPVPSCGHRRLRRCVDDDAESANLGDGRRIRRAFGKHPSFLAVRRRQADDRNRRVARFRRHAAHKGRRLDSIEIALPASKRLASLPR